MHAETLSFAEFFPFQRENILLLADYGTISIENGIIIPNPNRMHILKELYENDVICLHHVLCEDVRAEIEAMILAGKWRTESTLFSAPEAQYLNYMLNKKEFSNGLDLRNRYIHSSYPLDDRQELDYIELLKITYCMCLVYVFLNVAEVGIDVAPDLAAYAQDDVKLTGRRRHSVDHRAPCPG